MKKTLNLILGVCCIVLLSSCLELNFDVSHDPDYNYSFKYDHVYETREQVYGHFSQDSNYLTKISKKDSLDYDYRISGNWVVFPKKTLILITKLQYNTSTYILADRSMWAEGRVLNGKYKGKKLWVWLDKYREDENGNFVKNKNSNLVEEYPDPDVVDDLGLYSEWQKNNPIIPEPIIVSDGSNKE